MNLRVSLIQSDIEWENTKSNLSRFEQHISKLAGETDIIVLPEMFVSAFSMNPENIAVPLAGDITKRIRQLSEQTGACIIAGVATIIDGKYFNSLIWSEPSGKMQVYNKRHLFRMAGEHKHYTQGNELLTINYKSWRIRPFVCYDLRFPVWSRNVKFGSDAPDYEYDCAIYIANWPETRRTNWSTLLKARAIENQAYIVGVNRIGTDNKGFKYSGDSIAVSPFGEEISNITPSTEQVETVILDKEQLEKYRKKFPFVTDADEFNINMK